MRDKEVRHDLHHNVEQQDDGPTRTQDPTLVPSDFDCEQGRKVGPGIDNKSSYQDKPRLRRRQ